MSYKETIDGLARRNAELQAQLDQMTKNRATALEENERKRDVIQELRRELAGKSYTIKSLQLDIGEMVEHLAEEAERRRKAEDKLRLANSSSS